MVTQVQDPALCRVEPHTAVLRPSTQAGQIFQQSLPALQQVHAATQLGVYCDLTDHALNLVFY